MHQQAKWYEMRDREERTVRRAERIGGGGGGGERRGGGMKREGCF